MRLLGFLTIIALFLAALAARPGESDWIHLFNGKDLSGWHTNRAEGSFTVEDGLLVAHSLNMRSHLFYVGKEDSPVAFKDFELVVVARGEANSNSGIFIHTDYALRDDKGHLANGYEVNLNTSTTVAKKTGSLYDVVDLTEQPLDDTEWFETRIKVEGKHISVWLNGTKVIDYIEPENPVRKPSRKGRLLKPNGGAIALQAHDPESIWYFKEIKIRPLD
ncbi:MAG: DUF1080 domain-containing protein [Puniceicoccaceae bacterium]